MPTNYRLPLYIFLLFCLEGIIYFYAQWTVDDPNLTFAKSARNSGRISAGFNLLILFIVGFYGLRKIYNDLTKKDLFLFLMTLFSINHLIHFFYITRNFDITAKTLVISENLHGFITFITIILFPIIIWSFRKLNKALYVVILIHIFNTTYFFIITFISRVTHDPRPAYMHRIGIVIMILALVNILYRAFCENKLKSAKSI